MPMGCVPAWGGCLPRRGSVSQHVGSVSQHVMRQTSPPPPWTDFLTYACENITFPQLLLRAVIIDFYPKLMGCPHPFGKSWIRQCQVAQTSRKIEIYYPVDRVYYIMLLISQH